MDRLKVPSPDNNVVSSSNLANKYISQSVPNIQEKVESSLKVGKYDHVESKVLQYRRDIQRQERENHKRNNATIIEMQQSNNNQINNKTQLNHDDIHHKILIDDLEEEINELLKVNGNLLTKKAEADVKLDFFRFEVSRLTSLVKANVSGVENSSNLVAKPRSPFTMSGFFRTPIRSISNTLLKHSKGSLVCNSKIVVDLENESEVDFASDLEESDNNVFATKTNLLQINNMSRTESSSTTSERPLLAETQSNSLKTRVCKVFNNMKCLKRSFETNGAKEKSPIKKFKNRNKVDVAKHLLTPEINIKHTVTSSNNGLNSNILPVTVGNTPNKSNYVKPSLNTRFVLGENKYKTTEHDTLITLLNYAKDTKMNAEKIINLVNQKL